MCTVRTCNNLEWESIIKLQMEPSTSKIFFFHIPIALCELKPITCSISLDKIFHNARLNFIETWHFLLFMIIRCRTFPVLKMQYLQSFSRVLNGSFINCSISVFLLVVIRGEMTFSRCDIWLSLIDHIGLV